MTDKTRIVAISVAGLMMIAGFEGMRTDAYKDVVGIPTICYGHTKTTKMGMTKTEDQCWELLKEDVASFEKGIANSLPPLVELSQKEIDAYVSFAYNVGLGAWSTSTLLKKLKRGDREGACLELKRWVYAGGRKWRGLENRRNIESEICLQGVRGDHETKNGFWSDYYKYPLSGTLAR